MTRMAFGACLIVAVLVSLSACTGGSSPTAPAAPSDLTATPQSDSAVLRWQDNSSDEEAFEVERRVGDGEFELLETVASNATQLQVSLGTAGEHMSFRVRGVNAIGASAYSNSTTIVVVGIGADGGTVDSDAGVTVTFDPLTVSGDTSLQVVVDETPERPYAEGVTPLGPSTTMSLAWNLLSLESQGHISMTVPRYEHVPADDAEAIDYAAVFLNSSDPDLYAITYVPYDRASGELSIWGAELYALAEFYGLPDVMHIIVEPIDLAGWERPTSESSSLSPQANTEEGLFRVHLDEFEGSDATAECEESYQNSAEITGVWGTAASVPSSDRPPLILVHGWQVLGNYLTLFAKDHGGDGLISEAWQRLQAAVAPWHGVPFYRYAPQVCAWVDMLDQLQAKGIGDYYDVYTFGYDSDLGVVSNAARLKAVIEKFEPDVKVTLLAHSMGGLVSNAYIDAYGASRVNHLITLGTPYRGSRLLTCSGSNCQQLSLLLDSAAAQAAVETLAVSTGGSVLAAYSTLKTLLAAAAELEGTRNLAWDNPTLTGFNSKTRDYANYTSFYGNLSGEYGLTGLYRVTGFVVKHLTGHDSDGIVPLDSARLVVNGSARIGDTRALGSLDHDELKSASSALDEVIEELIAVAPVAPDPDPDPDPTDGADLIVGALSVNPTTVEAGANITVIFNVQNVGDTTAGASTVRVRINNDPINVTTSDALLAELPTSAIPGGQHQTYTETVTLPGGLAHGTHYIWVTADVFNEANQSDYGNDRASTPITIGPLTGRTETVVSASNYHTVAVRGDGTVWAWGNNGHGQLGSPTAINDIHSPITVPGLSGAIDVAAGYEHSLALLEDGTVWAWGGNRLGQLGRITEAENFNPPAQLSGLPKITAIDATWYSSIALDENGGLWTWGSNEQGQLGTGQPVVSGSFTTSPAQITTLGNITKFDAGSHHIIAVRSDGTAWGWGDNRHAQVGDGTRTLYQDRNVPVRVVGLSDVTSVAAGLGHSLAILANGTIWNWGCNGRISNGSGGTTCTVDLEPLELGGVAAATTATAGDAHSLALQGDGTVWSWAYTGGSGNELGYGHGDYELNTPEPVIGLSGAVGVEAGYRHSFAVLADGTIMAWGENGNGQLGIGNYTDRSTPTEIVWPPD